MASVIHYKFKNELSSNKHSFDGARMLYETLKRELFLQHFGRDESTDIVLEDEHSGKGMCPPPHLHCFIACVVLFAVSEVPWSQEKKKKKKKQTTVNERSLPLVFLRPLRFLS